MIQYILTKWFKIKTTSLIRGVPFFFAYFHILGIASFNWKYLIYEKRRKAPKKLNIPVDLNFIVVPYVYLFN